MSVGAVAMSLSTIIVAANAQLLLRKFYNGRHHTTVRHAVRRIETLRGQP
jgi:chromosomal replication initiation ATPase DnaA